MLSPGSKGWIAKYADMLRKGEIDVCIEKPKGIGKEHFTHLTFENSGIIFGFATQLLFATQLDTSKWTAEEKLKCLLFESHLFVFVFNGGDPKKDFDRFIDELLTFYVHHNSKSISRMFTFFLKESKDEKLEHILAKRTDIRRTLLDGAIWVNYLSNAFVYLDVILFREFLCTKESMGETNYEEFALNALTALTLSAYSDGKLESQEKAMFDVFLASANLNDERKEYAQDKFKKGAQLTDISEKSLQNWLFKRFLLDISALTIYSSHEALPEEKDFLKELCLYLQIPAKELVETLVMVERFVLNHNDQISFLQNRNSYERLYGNVSRRWIKILGRSKDKLALELRQSKELVSLIKKSTSEDLTKEEKEKVKTQFLDIVKSMPALAIFMLPGGALLLPIVLKIIPDLIPSAFRDNEIES
jgi:hypothetical protein